MDTQPQFIEGPKALEVEHERDHSENDTLKQPMEDFTDPSHPLYGTVDEKGNETPGNWKQILTVRAFVIAAILGAVFNVISLKLGLTGTNTYYL